ncbi:hypothetical protein [Deinococcus sp.]|uniref:hypothetical protein n=1 Tax=Deinococcus sp. TaxID=47478 RepID=UPI00286E70E0|nr:hypothetical protein [Deinococcus sp.]
MSRRTLNPLIHLPAVLLALPVTLTPQAAAQSAGLTLAGSLNGAGQPALSTGVTLRNAAVIGGFGLDVRLLADLGRGGGLDFSGLFEVPVNEPSGRLSVYAGPGLALGFGRPLRLRPSLTGGLSYDLDGQLNLFAEGSYQLQGRFRVRTGLIYSY